MNAQEYSEKVLAVLRRDGWTQGMGHDVDGRRCLLNAAMCVDFGVGRNDPVRWQWLADITDLLPAVYTPTTDWDSTSGIIGFNDAPVTTYEDVELLLKTHIHSTRSRSPGGRRLDPPSPGNLLTA